VSAPDDPRPDRAGQQQPDPTAQQPRWGQPPAPQVGQHPGWGQQQAWGQPTGAQHWQQPPASPYARTGAANPFDSETTLVLVMGILSLVVCGLLGIVAWVKGNDLRKRAEAAGWPEPGVGKVGRILGIVGTVIGVLQIGFAVLWVVLVFGVTASSGF